MTQYIFALLLLAFALLVIAMQKTYYFFPARELKRQARAGDREAGILYRAVAYGGNLRLLLWLAIGLAVAGSFVLMTAVAPGWIVFIAVAGLVWYGFAWSPNAAIGKLGGGLTLFLTPAVSWVLYYTHPLFNGLARYIERHRPVTFHTGLFERSDLIELIENQRSLPDSRIPHGELDMVLHALSFGDKTVGTVLVPKHLVKTVRQDDVVGPILMDEVYDSKHSRFPVVDSADTIIGTLFLRDMVAARSGGVVRDIMQPGANYVHEDQTLYQVLHAFLSTKHSIFVVINSAEDYVGIVTIEDVLEQVIGHKIEDDFDSYDDRRAVAAAGKEGQTKLPEQPTDPEQM